MRFKKRLQLEQGLKEISIVPLINIILLVLIFFIFTSVFVMPGGLKVNLPRAVTSEVIKYKNIELVVSGSDVIYLDNQVIELEKLKANLEYVSKRKMAVLIKADKTASLGRIVQIWDLCRKSGIAQINIATN